MAPLNRDASVQLMLESGENVNVFEIMKSKGVDPAIPLLAVQELPGRLFDVTFKSINLKRSLWPVLSSGRGYTVSSYSSSTIVVTVLHVPHELEDSMVRYVLGKYGKVIAGRFLTFKEYPNVYSGIRQYRIDLKVDIPSSLRLGGRNCWVRYIGQPRTCLKCGTKGHDVKDCQQLRCFRCQGLGHSVKECNSEVMCTVCDATGHSFRNCPVSFANKIKPTPMKWLGSGDEVADGGVDMPVTSDKDTNPPGPAPGKEEAAAIEAGVENQSEDTTFFKESVAEMDCEGINPQEPAPGEGLTVGSKAGGDMECHREKVTFVNETDAEVECQSQSKLPDEVVPTSVKKGEICDDDAAVEMESQSQDNVFVFSQMSQSQSPVAENESDKYPNFASGSVFKSKERKYDAKDRALRTKFKSSSLPTRKDRSRSRIRYPLEDPLDSIKMTQIFVEDEPWHSCYAKGCSHTFSSFNMLKDHTAKVHPNLDPSSYPCVLKKSCMSSFSTPREWIYHIASKHPEFVRKHDFEFFDQFFLKR